MSDDDKVLSKEEVEALLQDGNKENIATLGDNASSGEQWSESDFVVNRKILTSIVEITIAECEKNLTSFLHKKLTVTRKESDKPEVMTLAEYIKANNDKHVYTVFEIQPMGFYGMFAIDLPLLHGAINLLYGGQSTKDDQIIENPGKVGLIIAEKLAQTCIDAFAVGANEYGSIKCSVIKTISQANLSSKLSVDDRIYVVEMIVTLGSIESTVTLLVMDRFFKEFLAENPPTAKHVESNFWRSAIETQVADSYVEVQAVLPSISVKLNDLMALKEGSIIPISDPTLIYISLNDLKLFRANAGQANNKRVAKIISEV